MEAAAGLGLTASLWLTTFQLLLAAGVPLGALAWGGAHPGRLPLALRAASLGAALMGLGCVAAFAQVAGLHATLPPWLLSLALWAIAALFGLSLLGNVMSNSMAERLHGVPLAAILLGAALTCALAPAAQALAAA